MALRVPPLSLRAAGEADIAFLAALEEACMRDYAVALWGSWRPRPRAEILAHAPHILSHEGARDAGCISTSRHEDHVFVHRLYVRPQDQGRGFGAWMLRRCVAQAREAGLAVRLSVLTTNPAVRFYEREGFSLCSQTPERLLMVLPGA